MWKGSNKVLWSAHITILYQIRPKLFGNLELVINFEGLIRMDCPIFSLRGIIQLAKRFMSCTGIVPYIGTLFGRSILSLQNRDIPFRLQSFDQHGKCATNHTGPNYYNMLIGHKISPYS